MSKQKRHSFAALLSALALIVTLNGCNSGSDSGNTGSGSGTTSSSDKIVIGVYADLTGNTSTFGEETKNGVTLAVEEINAKGGVLGKQIELKIEDTRSDPIQAKNAVTKLIQVEKSTAIIGEVASKLSLAGAPVCQENGVPMITPSSTNPEVTKKGDYIFRVCFLDTFQGAVLAKFAHDNLKATKVSILYDNSNDYSVGLAEFFKEAFTKMGGTIAGELTFKATDSDFRSQLTTIRGQNPQVVFIPGYYDKMGLIARQAREQGITVPMLGGDGWSSPDLLKGAGNALEGCFFSDHYSPDDPDPKIQEFVKKYSEKFGKTPTGLAALAYDAANVLFAAMETAKSADRKAIRDALATVENFAGVSGNISMDENRDARKSASVLAIKGGKITFETKIEPADVQM